MIKHSFSCFKYYEIPCVVYRNYLNIPVFAKRPNTRFLLLRFRSALHCGYSGITDIQDGLFFVLTFNKLGSGADSQQQNIRENIQYFHSRPPTLSVIPL
jgi:hypothetical protein